MSRRVSISSNAEVSLGRQIGKQRTAVAAGAIGGRQNRRAPELLASFCASKLAHCTFVQLLDNRVSAEGDIPSFVA